jgi:hypothetical protein
MSNHFHLYLRTRKANLSEGIHYLNSGFANWLKAKRKIAGHIFQGRFGSIIVDDAAYALFLSAYIHLNPVRAKISSLPREYRWCSYNDFFACRKSLLPELDRATILRFLHPKIEKALPLYEKYVHDQMKVPSLKGFITQGIVLGDADYVRRLRARMNLTGSRREFAAALRSDVEPHNLEDIIAALNKALDGKGNGDAPRGTPPSVPRSERNQADGARPGTLQERNMIIYLAKKYCQLTLKDIGKPWRLDYGAVSQIARRIESRRTKSPALNVVLSTAEKILERGP